MALFLTIDHSQVHTDDGLYAGEEIISLCALTSSENDSFSVGIDGLGLEMELDPSMLSFDCERDGKEVCGEPQHDASFDYTADATERSTSASVQAAEGRPSASDAVHVVIVNTGRTRTAIRPFPKNTKSIRGRLIVFRRQLLTKASSKLKSIVKKSNSSLALALPHDVQKPTKTSSDNSTCAISLKSSGSSLDSCAVMDCMPTPSSITTSTCDFPSETNHQAVLASYMNTNAWDAAKAGDYATLHYICHNDDANIWAQRDSQGHVPLYYACTSYSQLDGRGSFGKYGLESVKLLVNVWPSDVDFPKALVRACRIHKKKSGAASIIHEDVLRVLKESNKVRMGGPKRTSLLSSVRPTHARHESNCSSLMIDGVSDVVPVSFLDDLGDDGYVEDY